MGARIPKPPSFPSSPRASVAARPPAAAAALFDFDLPAAEQQPTANSNGAVFDLFDAAPAATTTTTTPSVDLFANFDAPSASSAFGATAAAAPYEFLYFQSAKQMLLSAGRQTISTICFSARSAAVERRRSRQETVTRCSSRSKARSPLHNQQQRRQPQRARSRRRRTRRAAAACAASGRCSKNSERAAAAAAKEQHELWRSRLQARRSLIWRQK